MKARTLVSSLCFTLLSFAGFAQSRQITHISMSAVCDGKIGLWDHEKAMLNFTSSSQVLTMTTDVFEMTSSHTKYEHDDDEDRNGIPLTMTTTLSIPNLDFKSAKNNGETHRFEALVKCNNREANLPVTFTLMYAPAVSGSQTGAPLCSFRVDFVLSIDPQKFGLNTELGCKEMIIRVDDGLLNKLD